MATENVRSERDKLRDKIDALYVFDSEGFTVHPDKIADFILEDRRRIVEPLNIRNSKNFLKMTSNQQLNVLWEAAEETIKNAGVTP